MRVVVVTEGTRHESGRFLDKGCFRVDESKEWIPVSWMGSMDFDKLVGKAREMQRDEKTGEISFEIELMPIKTKVLDGEDEDGPVYREVETHLNFEDYDFFVFANELVEQNRHVLHGTIRQISVFLKPMLGANPGAKI